MKQNVEELQNKELLERITERIINEQIARAIPGEARMSDYFESKIEKAIEYETYVTKILQEFSEVDLVRQFYTIHEL
jgi:hypothetical protein